MDKTGDVTGQKANLVDLLDSILSTIARPRLDPKQAGQLFAEAFPEGFDSLFDLQPLSSPPSPLAPDLPHPESVSRRDL